MDEHAQPSEKKPCGDFLRRSKYLDEMCEHQKGAGTGPMGTHKTNIGPMSMNLPVSIGASCVLWTLAIVSVAAPEVMAPALAEAKSSVTQTFTWLYIGTNAIWCLFVGAVFVCFGHVKLGKDDGKPDFGDASYFMMIFCAGVAIGLIFYGAAEPLIHYISGNRYSDSGYLNANDRATHAINVTLYHWGVHGWVVYTTTAILISILCYKYDLPMTYRTCFFPLFGKATWGWFGDILDAITIAGTVSGVCTSLGMGAGQVVTAMQRINWLSPTCTETVTKDCLDTQGIVNARCILIAVITMCATASVVSGLDRGVKLLSQIAFGSGMFLLLMVLVLDNPWYLLNIMTQAMGVYIQNLWQIGWYTDAFAQLEWGDGKALDNSGANPKWMDWWTIFYWGWWISWSPFVGIFLAKISRNRTIREIIGYTFTVPLVYCMMWFSVFGGAAIKMHRRAEMLQDAGLKLYNNSKHFAAIQPYGTCFDVPKTMPCPAPNGLMVPTANCPLYTGEAYVANTYLSPVCLYNGADSDGFWFDLMNQYYGFGPLLCGFSIFTLVIYFVTSSDSGSMVVDLISTNGEEAHLVQRVYWSWTEGGVAIALLIVGGKDAMKALQAVSIISGVPFTIFVCLICISLWRVLKHDQGWTLYGFYKEWELPLYGGIFDIMEFVCGGGQSELPSVRDVVGFFLSAIVPPLVLFRIMQASPTTKNKSGTSMIWFATAACALTWGGFLVSLVLYFWNPAFMGIAFFCYCGFVTTVLSIRLEHRELYQIEGSPFEDFNAVFFVYHAVLWQLFVQVEQVPTPPPPREPKQPKSVDEPPAIAQSLIEARVDSMIAAKMSAQDACLLPSFEDTKVAPSAPLPEPTGATDF